MITKITIKNVATYDSIGQEICDLKKINFFFGNNGSGKTTISRIISAPTTYPYCEICWSENKELSCCVYNQDFVEKNFSEIDNLPGIFTLGKHDIDAIKKIEEIKSNINKTENILHEYTIKLKGNGNAKDENEGIIKKIENLSNSYINIFWEEKTNLDSSFLKETLTGVRGSKKIFFDEIIKRTLKTDIPILTFEVLESKAKQIYNSIHEPINELVNVEFENLLSCENNQILHKKIIGKNDIDIAGLINSLQNSDWVRQGKKMLNQSNGLCPFCQQSLPDDFIQKLEAYFDESFVHDIKDIDNLQKDYELYSTEILQKIEKIINQKNEYLDIEQLTNNYKLLKEKIQNNKTKIEDKKRNASISVNLDSLKDITEQISHILKDGNQKIRNYNSIIQNLNQEKNQLIEETWNYILNNIKTKKQQYLKEKNTLEEERKFYENKIKDNEFLLTKLKDNLVNFEKSFTSVIPTCNEINDLLSEFGFSGFKLEVQSDKKSYRLVRPNGIPVAKTLSEGERNFVTFLYFYSLLNGSQKETGETSAQIVVIDDPVSSLDHEILFIVSTLIRRKLKEILENKEDYKIEQIFILSHNLYFYKEVSYMDYWCKPKEMHHWNIKKQSDKTIITSLGDGKTNVQSTYESLWEELINAKKNPNEVSLTSIQNTMRRILEYYFKFLGNTNIKSIIENFKENDERSIGCCLISWINSGSHAAIEDFSYSPVDINGVEKYLHVFETIFHKSGHLSHYKMMMKISSDGIE